MPLPLSPALSSPLALTVSYATLLVLILDSLFYFVLFLIYYFLSGRKWAITGGAQIAINGAAAANTENVVEIAYVSGVIWQEVLFLPLFSPTFLLHSIFASEMRFPRFSL